MFALEILCVDFLANPLRKKNVLLDSLFNFIDAIIYESLLLCVCHRGR